MTTATAAPAVLGSPCPHCGSALVTERQAAPWCAACSWNLDFYDTSRRRKELRWKWADKMSFESAYDLNERQFATLVGTAVDKPPFSVAKFLILVLAILGLAFDIGLAVAGVWMIVHFGHIVGDVIGAVLIFAAFALRPRLGKLGKYAEPVDLDEMPAMDRLITRVAAEIGAPKPAVLLFDSSFNASSGAYGLRRRRFLHIGMALWLSLTAQERVALLGHELGHFVNGDVRRGPLSRYAFQLLRNLSVMTKPDSGASRYRARGLAALADVLIRPILAVISLIFALLEIGAEWLSMRASHHAEYAADAMAARAGGSAAMVGCLDTLLMDEACKTVLLRAARTEPDPARWQAAVMTARTELEPRRMRLRQLTMRDAASLAYSHPPTGLRAQLVESRAAQSAAVVVDSAEALAINTELAARYRTFRDGARA